MAVTSASQTRYAPELTERAVRTAQQAVAAPGGKGFGVVARR